MGVRGDQHLWQLLPQQAEVPRLPEEEMQCQAQPWCFPFQSSLKDLLENCPWNDPTQDREGQGCSQASADIRGCSSPLPKKKKMVIPSALKVLRLKAGRRFCSLGRLGHEVGWKYQDIVAALEAKRKVKGEAFYKAKVEVAKAKAALVKDAKIAKRIAPYQEIIESYGHQ